VSRVVATEAWLEEAKRLARDIAKQSPVALRLAKEAVNRAYEGALRLGVEYERQAFAIALSSEDAREGMSAFLEKRTPEFRGR
jgi:enoyl-CoA hydratase